MFQLLSLTCVSFFPPKLILKLELNYPVEWQFILSILWWEEPRGRCLHNSQSIWKHKQMCYVKTSNRCWQEMMTIIAHHGWGIVGQANFCSQYDLHILLSIYLRVWVGAAKEDLYIQWRYFNFDIPAKIPTFSILCYGKIWFECWSSHESAALKQTPSIWPSDPTLMSKLSVEPELSCHAIFEPCLQTACIYKVDKMKAWCWKGKVQEIQIKIDSLFLRLPLNVARGHTEGPLKM